jgi:hypothetical protein
MPLLLGPCMFLAPLVMVLAILAIPFWPVFLALLGAAWLIVWPIERLAQSLGSHAFEGATKKIGGWFRTLLTPWTYFDTPAKQAASAAPDKPASPSDQPPPQP